MKFKFCWSIIELDLKIRNKDPDMETNYNEYRKPPHGIKELWYNLFTDNAAARAGPRAAGRSRAAAPPAPSRAHSPCSGTPPPPPAARRSRRSSAAPAGRKSPARDSAKARSYPGSS
jgi:hypothetical protein